MDEAGPRPGGALRTVRRWIAGVSLAGFLIAHGFALVAVLNRSRDLVALGVRASATDTAVVGFEPLKAAVLGWGILLAGLAAAFAVRVVVAGRWSLVYLLVLVGLPVAAVLAELTDGPPPDLQGTFPLLPPPWVRVIGMIGLFAHPFAGFACLVVLRRRFRGPADPATASAAMWAGAFAVVAAVIRLLVVEVHACVVYSLLDPLAPRSLSGLMWGQMLQFWGSLVLAWLGLAALTVGLPALRGGAERAEEGR